MDDDLLADDGQYKDDGLDDLDIDAEAALLGLSDEEIEDERSINDDQELEYVDEDGNPVAIGENNADQYEVANIQSDKLSNQADEDVLELDDLDAELESFNQETTDLIDETPSPVKSYNDRQRKENLISLTSRREQERPVLRRKESRYSPVEDKDRSNKDRQIRGEQERPVLRRKESRYSPIEDKDRPTKDAPFSNQSHSSRGDPRNYGDDMEYDEESEDEGIADDHRERFKSERSNIITLTPAKRRTDIPDTLESVINVEETAKVQAFLENEQKRKMRFKGKTQGRMKPAPRFQRPGQNYPPQQAQQPPPQFSSPGPTSISQTVSSAPPQSRKILINPHFRGVRVPPPSEPAHVINESPQVSVPPTSYDTSNYAPPVQYSHPEPVHPVPPPIYTAPPPAVQYKHPEYPPQQHIQQIPPPMWQPPDMTVPSYSNPPPVLNYGDPVPQHHSYTNYNQSYQNANYQNPPMPMPQYSQPPPPVHIHTQPYPSQSVNPVPSTMGHTHYPPPPSHPPLPNQGRVQQIPMQSHHYQEPMPQPQMISHAPKPRFTQNQQRFSRPEKRSSCTNIRAVPMKQARIEPPQRKPNVHVNNSNIREIPLVDNLPMVRKAISANKVVPIVEDEDEKTKELRMKIEEQKLLREQILKRKEERRRQMATQRLLDLKKRQAEQNKNTVIIVPKVLKPNNNQQANQVRVAPAVKPVVKPSVKERIGVPLNQATVPTKKKIVVVRKKVPPQNTVNVAPNTTAPNLSPVIVGQRLRLPVPSQQQNIQQTVKPPTTAQQTILKQSPKANAITNVPKPETPQKVVQTKAPNPTTNEKTQPSTAPKKVVFTPQGMRGKKRGFGNRPSLQRPRPFAPRMQRMQRPRIPGPRPPGLRAPGPRTPGLRTPGPRSPGPRSPGLRGAQFPPPRHFMEHRMPFPSQGHPVNEMGMRSPHFQEPRPPLLYPPGEHGPGPYNHFYPHDRPFEPNNTQHFRMRGPAPQNFRPRGMEPMFRNRFPPPQFPNQMQQMRSVFENNMQRFPRHRFQGQNKPRFSSNNASNFNQKNINQPKIATKSPVSTPATPSTAVPNAIQKVNDTAEKNNEVKQVPKVTLARNQLKSQSDDKDVSKTHSVSVANLSSSTSEAQLKKLCSSVGVVENIQLIKSERKAVIKFKEPRQALSFQKKYQRYMLDLAMIQVSLLTT